LRKWVWREAVSILNDTDRLEAQMDLPGNSPRRWLVTGGCGFVGRNLIRRILSRPSVTLRIVDNLSVGSKEELARITEFSTTDSDALGRPSNNNRKVELVVGDIRDDALAIRAAEGADVIVHLAASTGVAPSVADPRFDCTTNVLGILNYLEAARKCAVKRFVFASSGAPIGECSPPIHEELAPHPVSPYGASKLAGEGYCSAYSRTFGIDTVALRFGNCYGPFSSHKESVVAKFIRESLMGMPWEIYGDGRQTRDFVYVDDIAAAIELAATLDGIGGETFQIATNSETTVLDLARSLAAILQSHGIAPPPIQYQASRVGDVKRNFSDTKKAYTRLGWQAMVSLDAGLRRTVEWFLTEGKLE
jgi:UDP-glucose 4-epimerase